jgi:hypothetical protein
MMVASLARPCRLPPDTFSDRIQRRVFQADDAHYKMWVRTRVSVSSTQENCYLSIAYDRKWRAESDESENYVYAIALQNDA